MFTTDSRTDVFLTSMGVKFRYTDGILFSELAPNWMDHNLGRPVPVRDAAVCEYAALMETRSPAPATILCKTERGLEVLDGVQRLCAAQLINCTSFPAYVVQCDSDNTITAIRVLANARLQGCPEPAEWTRRQAVELLVVNRGMSVQEVARLGGWSVDDISKIAACCEWQTAIDGIGGPSLPDTVLRQISQVTTIDDMVECPDVSVKFLDTIKRCRFSGDDSSTYIDAFFAPSSKTKRYKAYQRRLEEFLDSPEVDVRLKGRRGGAIPKDIVLLKELKSVNTTLSEIVDSGTELPYIDEFFKILKSIDGKLRGIKKCETPIEPRVPADKWETRN